MVEEEDEPARRLEDPRDLAEGLVQLPDVLEDKAGHGRVEGSVRERQGRRACPGVGRSAGAVLRDGNLAPRRVHTDDTGSPACHRQTADLALPATDVEHPGRAGEVLGRERQDLLLVLGVGAAGEALLPPLRMGFPELPVVGSTHWVSMTSAEVPSRGGTTGRAHPSRGDPYAD